MPTSKKCRGPTKRNPLDDFPMDYTRDDVMKTIEHHRDLLLRRGSALHKATGDSEGLHQYSKRRFDLAILNADPHSVPNCRNINEDKKVYLTGFNGPTRTGSLLYNRKAMMLNSIRVRPKSVPHHHQYREKKERVFPEIQCQHNSEEAMQSQLRKYMQYPKSVNDGSLVSPEQVAEQNKVLQHFYVNQIDVSDQISSDERNMPPRTMRTKRQIRTGPTLMRDSFTKDGGVYRFSWIRDTVVPQSGGTQQRNAPPTRLSGEADDKTHSRATSSASSSNDGPETYYQVANAPRCWVDDVTVSSLSLEDGLHTDPILENDNPQTEPKSVSFSKDIESGQPPFESSKVNTPTNMEYDANMEKNNRNVKVLTLSELQEQDLPLPRYICPSSESKSREIAIKEWLASSSFLCASRSVPLV